MKLADYEKVAFVRAPIEPEGLENVFHDTNHIDHEWWENESVTLVKKSRSTSVEDVVISSDGKVFLCCSVGWKEVRIEDLKDHLETLWDRPLTAETFEVDLDNVGSIQDD